MKKLHDEQMQLIEQNKNNKECTKTRIKKFRKKLSSGEILENFDRVVFENVIERIIVGGYNDEGDMLNWIPDARNRYLNMIKIEGIDFKNRRKIWQN